MLERRDKGQMKLERQRQKWGYGNVTRRDRNEIKKDEETVKEGKMQMRDVNVDKWGEKRKERDGTERMIWVMKVSRLESIDRSISQEIDGRIDEWMLEGTRRPTERWMDERGDKSLKWVWEWFVILKCHRGFASLHLHHWITVWTFIHLFIHPSVHLSKVVLVQLW